MRIASFKNYDDWFCFGVQKEQQVLARLQMFLDSLGENLMKHDYKKEVKIRGTKRTEHTNEDDTVNAIVDYVDHYEFGTTKVIIFWGENKVYITAHFTKRNRKKSVRQVLQRDESKESGT